MFRVFSQHLGNNLDKSDDEICRDCHHSRLLNSCYICCPDLLTDRIRTKSEICLIIPVMYKDRLCTGNAPESKFNTNKFEYQLMRNLDEKFSRIIQFNLCRSRKNFPFLILDILTFYENIINLV